MEKDRKTNIPTKDLDIIEWLIANCSYDELVFMADLATSKIKFGLLTSIFTKLTDKCVYEVFFEPVDSAEKLALFRAAKRGEVSGLKAFARACQRATIEIKSRKKKDV